MSQEIYAQILLMATAIILGLLIGFLFDIYRRLRNIISPGPLATFVGDLGFWIVVTIITFYSLLKVNSAQIRGYLFLGLGIGLIFYFHYISKYVIFSLVRMNILVKKGMYRLCCFRDKIYRLKIFCLPRRILEDAKRIYFKIRKR